MTRGKDVLKWIETYETKLNRSFFDDWDIAYYPNVLILPDGSLFAYTVGDDYIEIGVGSGVFTEFMKYLLPMLKALGKKRLTTITTRNPKAYARLSKSEITGSKTIDGVTYYYLEKEVF